jgi:hypothetical protein
VLEWVRTILGQPALVVLAATWLWHHLAGSRADALELRTREVAKVAYQHAALLGMTGDALLAKAHALAKEQLDKLGWSTLTDAALAVLDHELALVAADALPVQLDALNRQLAAFPATLQALHDTAYAEGKAFGDKFVQSVPDGSPDPTSNMLDPAPAGP